MTTVIGAVGNAQLKVSLEAFVGGVWKMDARQGKAPPSPGIAGWGHVSLDLSLRYLLLLPPIQNLEESRLQWVRISWVSVLCISRIAG